MTKKRNQVFFLIACCMVAIFFIGISGQKVSAKAESYVHGIKDGINLGNTYETGVEETKITDPETAAKIIANIKKEGFDTIRIPVTFYKQFDTKNGVVEKEFYDQIQVMVDAALNAKVKVILTMYGDSWLWLNNMKSPTATQSLYAKLWQQIALHFKDCSALLSFEGANAPYYNNMNQAEQLDILNKMNSIFVKTVRATGGNNATRTVFISTLNGAVTEETVASIKKAYKALKDKNVAVSVHYYGLWAFSVNAGGQTTYNAQVKKDITKFVSLLTNSFKKASIPFVCTEYGLYGMQGYSQAINHGETLKYFEEFFYQTKTAGIPLCLWDTGTLFEREVGFWSDETFAKLRKNPTTVRSAYVNTDSIYLKKGKQIQDVALTMALQGTTLKAIKSQTGTLKPQVDYVVKNKTVTIKASYLKSLEEKNKTRNGVYETLTFEFLKGVPFEVYVYGYNVKQVKTSSGTIESMDIPATFNGDQLIAMEAFDTSHKPAGPLNYTTYQEYGSSFEPDYEAGVIHLKKAFLSSLKEGNTFLVFHYASGETLSYTLVRRGTMVKDINYKESEVAATPAVTPVATPITTPVPTKEATIAPLQSAASVAQNNPENTNGKDAKLDNPAIISIILALAILLLLVYSVYFLRKRNMNKRMILGEEEEKSTNTSIDK